MFLDEKIERLMVEGNISYSKAKEILDKNEGDLEKALRYIEFREGDENDGNFLSSFLSNLKKIFDKGNKTKLVVLKRTQVLARLPLTFVVLSVFLGFNLIIVTAVIIFVSGCKVYIQRAE